MDKRIETGASDSGALEHPRIHSTGAGARTDQLALVNRLAVNAPTVDVNTCRCLCPGKFCTGPIGPPEAKLLSTIYPPATMGPGDVANASLTFANCSGFNSGTVAATWHQADGYRLKSRPAVDATPWTTSAVELLHPCAFGPCFEEVPPCTANFCYAHTFDFNLTAPMVTGSAPSPGNSLHGTRSSSVNLTWSWVNGAGSYNVKRCDPAGAPCIPATVVSTPTINQYSEPNDALSHFHALEAVNGCGATP